MSLVVGDFVVLKRCIRRYDLSLDKGVIGKVFGFVRSTSSGRASKVCNVQVDFCGVKATLKISSVEKCKHGIND